MVLVRRIIEDRRRMDVRRLLSVERTHACQFCLPLSGRPCDDRPRESFGIVCLRRGLDDCPVLDRERHEQHLTDDKRVQARDRRQHPLRHTVHGSCGGWDKHRLVPNRARVHEWDVQGDRDCIRRGSVIRSERTERQHRRPGFGQWCQADRRVQPIRESADLPSDAVHSRHGNGSAQRDSGFRRRWSLR